MLDELKNLEVDWSMERTIGAIEKAIAAIESGKEGKSLYEAVCAKVAECEDYYDRPMDKPETYEKLGALAKKFGDDKMAKHASLQINIFKSNDLEFLGRQQQFYGNSKLAVEYYRKSLDLYPQHELSGPNLEKARLHHAPSSPPVLQGQGDRGGQAFLVP